MPVGGMCCSGVMKSPYRGSSCAAMAAVPIPVNPASGVRNSRLFMIMRGCLARTSRIKSEARHASSPWKSWEL